ncbi:hypothetical protein J132_02163 [Termitomyces sp. J132]|nr:hypothetical protein J132_02163 [Termitomyces sp. J132]
MNQVVTADEPAQDIDSIPSYTEITMEEGGLLEVEIFWRDHYLYLKEHGYTLRRRYEPDWTPSWITDNKEIDECEDSIFVCHAWVIDATRRDGTYVALKKVDASRVTARNELAVGKLFTSPELSLCSGNRCVPILDIVQPKEGSDYTFIVMPLLYPVDTAPFETIGEVIEFFRQIFEGLQFMHNHNVAHGDCKWNNIMADLGSSYDHPPHPIDRFTRRDFRGHISAPLSRTTKPVKYYLIDFDLSKIYGKQDVRLRMPPWGGDKTVPEHLVPNAPPCDPFRVDVYCVGNIARQRFLDVGMSFVQVVLS